MATAVPSKGTQFWIEKGSNVDTSLMIIPTAISKTNPTSITCVASAAKPGQVVFCDRTGFPELDGKYFLVDKTSTPTALKLTGSNTTNSQGVLSTDIDEPPKVCVYVEGIDALPLCVSTFSYDAGTAQSINVGTFCDPLATIPGAPTDGSATFAGYTSPTDGGYRELMDAAHLADFRVIYIRVAPSPRQPPTAKESGVIVLEGTINSYKETYDIGQAISWTSGMSLTRASRQIWETNIAPYTPPADFVGGTSGFGLPVVDGNTVVPTPPPPEADALAAA